MRTKETIEAYFDAIHDGGWESYIADDFDFVVSNVDNVYHGKEIYLERAGRFFQTTTSVEIRQMIIDDGDVAVLARYQVRSPEGNTGVCDVAEFLTVEGEKLSSSAIFFDTEALAEFMAQ